MATNSLQPYTRYIDGQVFQIAGPDNSSLSYQYDQQQRTFYIRESLVNPINKHGVTHTSTDLIPAATCNTPGLMTPEDKCKLDAFVGTRIGVLGFQGAGFPDDGGWLSGNVILSAGSDFISLERVGNIIRFVVDVPSPFMCASEQCFQIYWAQDESEVNAVRPPSCASKFPGINGYGELKIYVFPESTVVNTNNPMATLTKKGQYPSLIFKRYDDGTGTNEAEFDMVLKRNPTTSAATVGWGFTPGALGQAQCVWYMGLDDKGNRIDFKIEPNSASNLLGAVMYKNNSITKQMAVITSYATDTLTANKYKAKFWSLTSQAAVGDEFTITNLQQHDLAANVKVLDAAFGSVLSIGQLVDVWTVNCGTACYYCKERPILNTNGLWATLGVATFGDTLQARSEYADAILDGATSDDFKLLDPTQWGLTSNPEALLMVDSSEAIIPSTGQVNYSTQIVSTASTSTTLGRRYLEVIKDPGVNSEILQRPTFLWHRASLRNALMEIHLARPVATDSIHPPIDVLLRAPVSTITTKYGTVISNGTFAPATRHAGKQWVKLAGVQLNDIPASGAVRVVMAEGSYTYGQLMTYFAKAGDLNSDYIYLITDDVIISNKTVVEFLHEEYTTTATRLQFAFNSNMHDLEMRAITGTLDMGVGYPYHTTIGTGGTGTSPVLESYVRDFSSYQSSPVLWQNGSADTTTGGLTVSNEGFYVMNGGDANGQEFYNTLRIMMVENQVWVWWNNLLVPTQEGLPYFTVTDTVKYGKFGLRMWPGARVRRVILRSKLHMFSELSLGQLEMS